MSTYRRGYSDRRLRLRLSRILSESGLYDLAQAVDPRDTAPVMTCVCWWREGERQHCTCCEYYGRWLGRLEAGRRA